MSRKWNEAPKPVRCKDCEGFCHEDCCMTKNCRIRNPDQFRYCTDHIPRKENKK